jgi:hypothetical protein
MIYPLDEVSLAFYKKAKCLQDQLDVVDAKLEATHKMMHIAMDLWLLLEDKASVQEANVVYYRKLELEREHMQLYRTRQVLLQKVTKYVG